MTHNIQDYNQCTYVQKSKAKKAGWFVLVFFVMSVLLIFSLSDFISGMISGRGSLVRSGKISLASFSVYAIELGQYSKLSDAKDMSKVLAKQGGAGYIHQSGDYHVFVSMYESYSDAEQIKINLENNGLTPKIYTINLPSIKLELSDKFSVMEEAIDIYRATYKKLYNLAIEYDSGNISKLKVTTDLNLIKGEFEALSQSVYDIVLESNNATAILVKNSLDKVIEALSVVLSISSDSYDFNSAVKYCYFEVIFAYLDLAKNL